VEDQPEGEKKKGIDLSDLIKATQTEFHLEPFGRVLIGTLSVGALMAVEKALSKEPNLEDEKLVRVLLGSTLRVPVDGKDRKLTEAEVEGISENDVTRFSEAYLQKKDWQHGEAIAVLTKETPVANLAETIRVQIKRFNDQTKSSIDSMLGPMKSIFSGTTQSLFRESEKIRSLFQNSAAPYSFLGATFKGLEPQWDTASLTRLTDTLRSEQELRRPPAINFNIPRITPVSEHVERLSSDLGRVIERLETLTEWTGTNNRLLTSALGDITTWRSEHESSSRKGLWIAVGGILMTTLVSAIGLLVSLRANKDAGQSQRELIHELQQQNQTLKSLLQVQAQLPPPPIGPRSLKKPRAKQATP